jgi:hypothetical protein
MMATEGFIQFIWKHRLYDKKSLCTACGQKLEVLDPGEQNPHAGPDFFNARIRLDQMVWAGNVEIHPCASDWYKHGHHLDPAYNNVILHVVGDFDTDVTNSLGRRIQTMVPAYPQKLIRRYTILKRSDSWLPCGDYIRSIPIQRLKPWLHALHTDRISQKSMRMEEILHASGKDLNEAFYRALAHGYGIPINTLPFDLLAKKIPMRILLENRYSISDLEAILFGHSGLLFPARDLGPYPSSLWNRYTGIRSSFTEKPVPRHLWRFLRLRPPSFPTLRISQFASLLCERIPLAESILESSSIGELEQVFRTGASEYWTNHYLFGLTSPPLAKYPGDHFVSTLIINIIVPFLKALDKYTGHGYRVKLAGKILEKLKAESNQIIKNWGIFGIGADNAMESQALLQLYHYYCKQKRCLDCQIGAELVKTAIHEKL